MISIIHSGNLGDLIYSLPAMRQAHRNSGEDIEVIICINQPGDLSPDHPSQHNGKPVQLSEKMAQMAAPLLQSLDFVNKVTITDNPHTKCDYDFNKFRRIGLTYSGNISRWYFYAFPELTCDLSEPIFIAPSKEAEIVLNRSQRYHGGANTPKQSPAFDYLFLRPWADRMAFIGLELEYDIIKKKLPGMRFIPVDNFLDMAAIIRGADLFIGNQSMPFAIAEITKTPRVLEVCRWAQNVIPTGANGWDAWDIINMREILERRMPIHDKAKAD